MAKRWRQNRPHNQCQPYPEKTAMQHSRKVYRICSDSVTVHWKRVVGRSSSFPTTND
jgi:hypothetical protein